MGVQRVDDALYELDSTMQAGNQNASPPYVLSQLEKASASATEFSTAFNNFIADGPNSPHAEIIRTVFIFSGAIADVLSNTKGLTRLANDDKSADQLTNGARKSAQATVRFFRDLQSFRLQGLEPLQKTDVVITIIWKSRRSCSPFRNWSTRLLPRAPSSAPAEIWATLWIKS